MSWKDKINWLKNKKKDLQAQYNRGKVVTEQMRADKLRKRMEKRKYMEPGTISYGIATRQHPWDFTKDLKTRRVEKRKEKQQKQKK